VVSAGRLPCRERRPTMSGREVVRAVEATKTPDHRFIKWWRKENDFTDLELIDTFIAGVGSSDEIGGFELLDMDQAWRLVTRLCPDRVSRRTFDRHEEIIWDRKGKDGALRSYRCDFSPEFLLKIFDVETRGNYVD